MENGYRVTENEIKSFLVDLQKRGRTRSTIAQYRSQLLQLKKFLGEEGLLNNARLAKWKGFMQETGLANESINARISAANSLLAFAGHREWQLVQSRLPKEKEEAAPELTRQEYLRLLQAAKLLKRKRSYYLIKVFGCTGIKTGDIPYITVERLRQAGNETIVLENGSSFTMPVALVGELLQYAEETGVCNGPVFCTRNGKAIDRRIVWSSMKSLCSVAQVDERKVTVSSLEKMYRTTCIGIDAMVAVLREQAYAKLLADEEKIVGLE